MVRMEGVMGEGAVIDMLDAEYTMPGELLVTAGRVRSASEQLRAVEAWPERAQREIDDLRRRVERLEQAVMGSAERKVVLLHWKGDELVRGRATAMHIKPYAPAIAVALPWAGRRRSMWSDLGGVMPGGCSTGERGMRFRVGWEMTSSSDGAAHVEQTAALVDLMDRAVAAVEEAQELMGEEDQSVTAAMLRSVCFQVRDVRGRLERRLALQRGGG